MESEKEKSDSRGNDDGQTFGDAPLSLESDERKLNIGKNDDGKARNGDDWILG